MHFHFNKKSKTKQSVFANVQGIKPQTGSILQPLETGAAVEKINKQVTKTGTYY
jgi:hypothetical protein